MSFDRAQAKRLSSLTDIGVAVATALEWGCTPDEIREEVEQELAFHENDDEDD